MATIAAGERRARSRLPILFILVASIPLIWVLPFVRIVPRDYVDFLLPWYEHIRAAGAIASFTHPFSNYTPPYLYLLTASTFLDLPPLIAIKLVSALGSLWTGYAIFRLLTAAGVRQSLEAGLAALLLPTIVINAPIFAQADMFWVAPCLLAIAAAYRDRLAEMVFWAGLGFAFKAQAIFIAPFVIAVLLTNRASFWLWLIPALVYAAAMLPAWLAGWPARDLLTIYLRQAQYVPPNGVRFVSTASNWWALFAYLDYDGALGSFWIGFVAAAAATILYVHRFASKRAELLVAAAISSTMLPFLLPGMHERFFAFAELTVFCLAWAQRTPRTTIAAVLMQVQLLLSSLGWIVRLPELAIIGAALVTTVLWLLLSHLRRSLPPVANMPTCEAISTGTFKGETSFTISQTGAGYGARVIVEPRAHV